MADRSDMDRMVWHRAIFGNQSQPASIDVNALFTEKGGPLPKSHLGNSGEHRMNLSMNLSI